MAEFDQSNKNVGTGAEQSSVDYCQLMSLRRLALLKGDEALAFELHQAAEALIAAGLVSDDEMLAAGYGV
jgi:hypothetical protein